MNSSELYCQMGHCFDIHGNRIWCQGVSQSGPRMLFHEGHTITLDRRILVLRVEENEEITHDLLSFALRKKDVYICPHLNASSPNIFDGRPLTADCPNYTFSEIQQREELGLNGRYRITCYLGPQFRHLRLGECITWSQCPEPHCFTHYYLRRIWILRKPRYSSRDQSRLAWLYYLSRLGGANGAKESNDRN
jgi:hypothetical protein